MNPGAGPGDLVDPVDPGTKGDTPQVQYRTAGPGPLALTAPGELALTGSDASSMLLLAMVLILSGALLQRSTRRRRE